MKDAIATLIRVLNPENSLRKQLGRNSPAPLVKAACRATAEDLRPGFRKLHFIHWLQSTTVRSRKNISKAPCSSVSLFMIRYTEMRLLTDCANSRTSSLVLSCCKEMPVTANRQRRKVCLVPHWRLECESDTRSLNHHGN